MPKSILRYMAKTAIQRALKAAPAFPGPEDSTVAEGRAIYHAKEGVLELKATFDGWKVETQLTLTGPDGKARGLGYETARRLIAARIEGISQ